MATLRKSLRQKISVHITIAHPDTLTLTGIVTVIKPDFIVVREIDSFELAGTIVLPIATIVDCTYSSIDRCQTTILARNGQLDKLSSPRWLEKCTTIEEVFEQLHKRDIWPIIEIVEGKDSWFCIGPITEVDSNGSMIRHYDGAGKWVDEYPVAYDNLVKVEFGDKYSKHFNNYMRSKLK